MALHCVVATYGQRFLAVRLGDDWQPGQKPRLTQEAVAERTISARKSYKRAAPISNIERLKKPPKRATIEKHAKLLSVEPRELLIGVPCDLDRLRWPDLSEPQLEALLAAVSLMSRTQREVLAMEGKKLIAQRGVPLVRSDWRPSRESKPVNLETAEQMRRGKKRA